MENYLIKIDEFSIKSEDHICYIDLSAKSSKNAISFLLASLINDILFINPTTQKTLFEDFLKNEKIVIVVLRSLLPDIFASGGHLGDLRQADKLEHMSYADNIREFCKLLSRISIPSITIISGKAYGGGVELALAPDFRWTIGKNIEFHFSQAKFCLPGGWGGMARLTELNPVLSIKKVSTLFLVQEVFSFQDLLHYSLIDKQFDNEKACYIALEKWRDKILFCEPKLKEDFFYRNQIELKQLNAFDLQFFRKYFLSENHKKCIAHFLDFKNKD